MRIRAIAASYSLRPLPAGPGILAILVSSFLGSGCATSDPGPASGPASGEVSVSSLAKTDADRIIEIHLEENRRHLRDLMEKLYRRNSTELRKSGASDLQSAIDRAFQANISFPELQGKTGIEAIHLAFSENYQADRVLAFIVGLRTMLLQAYEGREQFFLLDQLDPQKIYNSARNIEIAAWKLGTAKNRAGQLYLLSNDIAGEVRNLSFERLFGKLIAQQDVASRIVAERTNRTVVRIIQNLATAVFLPL